jgi:hypothetical protein
LRKTSAPEIIEISHWVGKKTIAVHRGSPLAILFPIETSLNDRDQVAENTDRTDPNVPKLSDDRGCLGRYCQGGNGGDPS